MKWWWHLFFGHRWAIRADELICVCWLCKMGKTDD